MKKKQNHQNIYHTTQNERSKENKRSRLFDYEFGDEEFGNDIDQLELQKEETRKATHCSNGKRRKKTDDKTA